MNILREGIIMDDPKDPEKLFCNNCRALFEFDNKDIKYDNTTSATVKYVECPCCNEKILVTKYNIETKNKNIEINFYTFEELLDLAKEANQNVTDLNGLKFQLTVDEISFDIEFMITKNENLIGKITGDPKKWSMPKLEKWMLPEITDLDEPFVGILIGKEDSFCFDEYSCISYYSNIILKNGDCIDIEYNDGFMTNKYVKVEGKKYKYKLIGALSGLKLYPRHTILK